MIRFHPVISSLILLLIRSTSSCDPVNEYDNQNVTTTNASHLIGYQLRAPCPALYRLASIIDAELSNPSTSQPNALNITDLLRTRCLSPDATPCSVDVPLRELNVQGAPTVLNVKVNYTCQLDDPGWPAPPKSGILNEKEISQTSFVRYILVKLVGFGRPDWNCTVSSSGGSAVNWSWRSKNCGVTAAFGCLGWNRTVVASSMGEVNSLFCLAPRSIGRTLFVTNQYCSASPSESIIIDLQVPLDSDFDITCNPQSPQYPPANDNDLADRMQSDCSQLTWMTTRPHTSTYKDLPASTPRTTTPGAVEIETPVADKKTDYATPLASKDLLQSRLSLGLGIGLGLLLLVLIFAVILIAVVCIRRKNRGFNEKTSKLAKPRSEVGGVMEDKDGGFVLANDIFTIPNIYSGISDAAYNPNPRDVPRVETPEIGYRQESTPPAATSPPPGDRPAKRASTLSRKLFKQIAVIAKQEEHRSQGPVEGEARGRPDGESQTSLVDRWLYSSTLNSPNNTLNQRNQDGESIYINRRFEMDI